MGTSQTSASFAAKHITVDRKWAVTGTPVPGLLGLNFGLDTAASGSVGENEQQRVANPHSKDVSGDLARLGHIVVDFLALAPWSYSPGMWSKYCSMPFLSENRHEVVERLLQQVMVRHRWRDLELDVQIPELTHRVVKLEPSLMNKIAINLFNANVAVNAVSSDRVDQDYLFHRSNMTSLRRLVSNLQHSTFYWTGHEVEDIEHSLKVANECLVNGKAYTDHDQELLKKSIEVMNFALQCKAFHLSVKHQEVCESQKQFCFFLETIKGLTMWESILCTRRTTSSARCALRHQLSRPTKREPNFGSENSAHAAARAEYQDKRRRWFRGRSRYYTCNH